MTAIAEIWATMPTAERFAALFFPPALLVTGTLLVAAFA